MSTTSIIQRVRWIPVTQLLRRVPLDCSKAEEKADNNRLGDGQSDRSLRIRNQVMMTTLGG